MASLGNVDVGHISIGQYFDIQQSKDTKITRVDVLQKETKNTHSYEKSAPAEIPLPSKKKKIELKCDYCPENFNTDSLFKTHYKTNHPNRPIIAPGDSA